MKCMMDSAKGRSVAHFRWLIKACRGDKTALLLMMDSEKEKRKFIITD